MADAPVTQREVCQQIVDGGGDYLLPLKENQPTLYRDLAEAFSPTGSRGRLRAKGFPVAGAGVAGEGAILTVWVDGGPGKKRHGRLERRELWALSDPELNGYAGSSGAVGEAWPHLRQVCWLERRRTVKGRSQVTVSYALTNLPATAAGAKRLLKVSRGHWGIKNRVHWVRDVTLGEDRSQIRTGAAPQVMAGLRNLVIALVRRAGHTNVAVAPRRHTAHLPEPFALLGIPYAPGTTGE